MEGLLINAKERQCFMLGLLSIFLFVYMPILYTVLVGIVTQITGKSNYGVFSIILLFIIGGIILIKVPDKE
ncbi:hypothetical protein [Clostridium kluyveri]